MKNPKALLIIILVFLFACGKPPKKSDTSHTSHIDTFVVTEDTGGSYQNSRVSLKFLPGAFPETVTIAVQTVKTGNSDSIGEGIKLWILSGEDIPLNTSATLTFKYTDDEKSNFFSSGQPVVASMTEGNKWNMLPYPTISQYSNEVTVQINKLSTFTLFPDNSKSIIVPPMIKSVSPSINFVKKGESTSIRFDMNFYYSPDNPTCKLFVNNVFNKDISSGDTVNLSLDYSSEISVSCSNSAGSDAYTGEITVATAPVLKRFYVSPPFVSSSPTKVMWSWEYENEPNPKPTCKISGPNFPSDNVTNGQTDLVSLPFLSLSGTYILTCSNKGGSSSMTYDVTRWENPPVSSITISPFGGTYSIGGFITFTVPPDAITQPVTISFARTSNVPNNGTFITVPFELTPSMSFKNPITMTITINPQLLSAAGITNPTGQLQIATYASGRWNPLFSVVNTANNTITAQLNHFSTYSVMSEEDKQKQPLRSALNVLSRSDEVALFMPGFDDGKDNKSTGLILQDAKNDPDMGVIATINNRLCLDKDNGGEIIDSEGGDFDGDGKKELAVLCRYKTLKNDQVKDRYGHYPYKYEIELYILDDVAHNRALLGKRLLPSRCPYNYHTANIAVGNFDASNRNDEITVMGNVYKNELDRNNRWVSNPYSSKLYVYKYNPSDNILKSIIPIFQDSDTYKYRIKARVAAGDIDGDHRDEIVVVAKQKVSPYHIKAYVYNDARRDFKIMKKFLSSTGGIFNKRWVDDPNVAVGDIDGDHYDEIIFTVNDGGYPKIEIYNDWKRDYKLIDSQWVTNSYNKSFESSKPSKIKMADLDGDFIKDVFMLFHNDSEKGINSFWCVSTYYLYLKESELKPKRVKILGSCQSYVPEESYYIDGRNETSPPYKEVSLAVGDINNDLNDEALVLYDDKLGHYYLDKYERAEQNTIHAWPKRTQLKEYDYNESHPISIAVDDFDGDNAYLEYTGEYYDVRSPEEIIMLMAAPPAFRTLMKSTNGGDYLQNQNETYSEYGNENYTGSANSTTIGDKSGITYSGDYGISLFKILTFGYGWTKTMEKEWTSSTTDKKEKTVGTTRKSGYMNDTVIWSVQNFVSYKYRILAHPDKDMRPVCDSNGKCRYKYVYIDIPNGDPIIFSKDIKDYPGDKSVFKGIFKHKPGFPETYMLKSEADNLVDTDDCDTTLCDSGEYTGWMSDGLATVDTGAGGGHKVYINLSTEHVSESSQTIINSASWYYQVPGLGKRTFSDAHSFEQSYQIIVGNSVEYSGSVGNVISGCFDSNGLPAGPCAGYDAFDYKWGMFVYNKEPEKEGDRGFQVLNYWVDDSSNHEWEYYNSFATIPFGPKDNYNTWYSEDYGTNPESTFELCDIENNLITNCGSDDAGGVLHFSTNFINSYLDEYKYYGERIAEQNYVYSGEITMEIKYRIVSANSGIDGIGLRLVKHDQDYGNYPIYYLAENSIPDEDGNSSNGIDTGWQTAYFNISNNGDFDKLLLFMDDKDDVNGIYNLYVDYIRIYK